MDRIWRLIYDEKHGHGTQAAGQFSLGFFRFRRTKLIEITVLNKKGDPADFFVYDEGLIPPLNGKAYYWEKHTYLLDDLMKGLARG